MERNEEPGPQSFFIVNIVTAAPGQGDFTARSVMGIAVGSRKGLGVPAWAFYEIVQASALRLRIDAGILLGHVMAHEIGHLLLANNAHSQTGLMRAGWDQLQVTGAIAGVDLHTQGICADPEQAVSVMDQL